MVKYDKVATEFSKFFDSELLTRVIDSKLD